MSREGEPIRYSDVRKERIKTREGTVTYGVIQHERTDVGTPVFFLPGYGEGMKPITPVSGAIAEKNASGDTREVIMIRHSRRQFRFGKKFNKDTLRKLYPNASKRAFYCHNATLRRAHEAILVLDKLKTKAHLAGHSYGGMTAVCIGLLRPDLVESITLLNSGGLVGVSDSWIKDQWTLTRRFVWDNWRAEIKVHGLKMLPIIFLTFGYILLKFGRGVRENFDVARSDMIPAMRELAQKGIKITVVYDELDKVFPAPLVREQLQRLPAGTPIEIVTTNEHLHYGPVTNPIKYGRRVRSIVDGTGK